MQVLSKDDIIEAPEYSIVEYKDSIAVRIDSGKFMDSDFYYSDIGTKPNEDGEDILTYGITIMNLIVNGVFRDELETRHKFPELIEELLNEVATPVLNDLVKVAQGEYD